MFEQLRIKLLERKLKVIDNPEQRKTLMIKKNKLLAKWYQNHNIKTEGFMNVIVHRASGKSEIIEWQKPNLLTNGGRDYLHAAFYTDTTASKRGIGYLAVTTDATAPAAGDTTLASEISTNGLQRAEVGTKTHSAGTNTTLFDHTFNSTGTHTSVQKCGTFSASSGGTMGHENTFTAVSLSNGDSLQLQWTFTAG